MHRKWMNLSVVVVVAITVLAPFNSFVALAEGPVASGAAASDQCGKWSSGGTVSTEEGQKLSPEERAKYGFGQCPSAERVAQAEKEASTDPRLAQKLEDFKTWQGNATLLYPSGTMYVPYIEQSENYYCGPASTLMALRFMDADGDLSSNDVTAQDELWDEVGNTPETGSDSTLIASALNDRQSENYYLGGYYNMDGCDESCFQWRWQFDFDLSTPGIPSVDTEHLESYDGHNYSHFITQRGYDWGVPEVSYNDPNNIEHGGIYTDKRSDMYTAITHRNNGLRSYVW